MLLTVRNPATGALLAEVPTATKADVDAAATRARAAQPAWGDLGALERARLLDALRAALLDARLDVADLVTRETGKPFAEALGSDVLAALDALKWAATKGPRVLAPEKVRLSNPLFLGRASWIEREPLGVVGVISPWNYPLAIPAGNVAYALLAGNAVLLKPASHAPLTALKLRELMTKAGIPEDVCIVLPGSGKETGEALLAADVDHVVFTGSVPVGRDVDRRLRERGVSTTMELGGSDPAIVLDDAHFDNAVRGVLWARFTNCGQTCAATKRVLVHRSLHDRFVAALVDGARALRLGDPTDPHVDLGPLTDPRAVEDMLAFVEDARKRGGRALCGGRARPDLGPQYFEPTVVVDLPPDARLLADECFGPILPVVAFDTEDEAVRLANGTPFGLSASVWTSDPERGRRLARRLHAGTVTVNDALYTFAANETPWGGVKASGHGRTHGPQGLLEMTRLKHVNVTPAKVASPWWFPYGPGLRDTFVKGAAFLYGEQKEKVKVGAGLASNLVGRLRARR
jgi:succinate-semialdehyde dehydrogenase/glutarate-semialdehyde dehydrogenase